MVRQPRSEVFKSFVIALPALTLPFVIRAAVVEGVATATEVSTIGIVYSCVIGICVYRQFDVKRLYPILIDTAILSGAILLIIGRSEEHTSELQSLMRISYAVFCLTKKTQVIIITKSIEIRD